MNFGPQNFTIFNGFWQYFPNLKLNFSRTTIHNDLKFSGYIYNYNIYLQHNGFFKTHFCFKVIAWNPLKNGQKWLFLLFFAIFGTSNANFERLACQIDLKFSGYVKATKCSYRDSGFLKILFWLKVMAQKPKKWRIFKNFTFLVCKIHILRYDVMRVCM